MTTTTTPAPLPPALPALPALPPATPPSTATLPTWTTAWARSAGVGSLIVGALAGFMVLHRPGELGNAMAASVIVAQIVIAIIAVPTSLWLTAPVRRLQALLARGVAPEALPRDDVILALRLAKRTFNIVLGGHVAFAVVYVAASRFSDVLAPTALDFIIGTPALGFISGSVQAYAMTQVVRERVTPVLLPRGRLEHLVDDNGKVKHTYIYEHLFQLVVTLTIAWPLFLFSIFRNEGAPSIAKLVLLGLLVAFCVVFQAAAVFRIISFSVGHLAERMEEVRKGRLDVQATLFHLDTFGLLSSDFNRMVEGLRQREHLKETFGRYVTQQVVDEILAGRVALGGELKTATVLFSDIRGFTRMSEKLTPQEVVAFLNEYLAAMVDCVIEHGGVLDKFIGDAVMAVFGAPVSRGDARADAEAAVACAVAMGRKLDEMNARRKERGQPPIAIGIGVHTGELVAGNIGSPRRMQYTVIGDTVNVGSRLESLTKEHARRTLLSAATAALVKDRFSLVEVGRVPVRGREEMLQIFGLEGDEIHATKTS